MANLRRKSLVMLIALSMLAATLYLSLYLSPLALAQGGLGWAVQADTNHELPDAIQCVRSDNSQSSRIVPSATHASGISSVTGGSNTDWYLAEG